MSTLLYVSLVQATLRREPSYDPRTHRYEWTNAQTPELATAYRAGYWPRSRMLGAEMAPLGLGQEATTVGGSYEYPYKILAADGAASGYHFCGTTRDSAGAALGTCVVQGFATANDAYLGECTSGPTGEYCLTVASTQASYLVAYKAGAPDVAGTTVNTLVPTTTRTI